jgi:hypothetical protein
MAPPDPIQYAERLYAAIRAANFSPISFLAFGNAIKDGVSMRNMPRIAAEPFMRVVGEMLNLDEVLGEEEISEAVLVHEDSGGVREAESPSAIANPGEVPPIPVAETLPPLKTGTGGQ